jgi:hypothetical protein
MNVKEINGFGSLETLVQVTIALTFEVHGLYRHHTSDASLVPQEGAKFWTRAAWPIISPGGHTTYLENNTLLNPGACEPIHQAMDIVCFRPATQSAWSTKRPSP